MSAQQNSGELHIRLLMEGLPTVRELHFLYHVLQHQSISEILLLLLYFSQQIESKNSVLGDFPHNSQHILNKFMTRPCWTKALCNLLWAKTLVSNIQVNKQRHSFFKAESTEWNWNGSSDTSTTGLVSNLPFIVYFHVDLAILLWHMSRNLCCFQAMHRDKMMNRYHLACGLSFS